MSHPRATTRTSSVLLILVLALLATALTIPFIVGGQKIPFNDRLTRKMEEEQSDLLFIGNSMMESRIDGGYIFEATGLKPFLLDAGKVMAGPSMVGTWYLWLKNLVAPAKVKFKKVFIFFVDEQLTATEFWLDTHDTKGVEAILTLHEPEFDRLVRHKNGSWYGTIKEYIHRFYARSGVQEPFRQRFSSLLMGLVGGSSAEQTKGEINSYLKTAGRRPAFDVIHDTDFHPRDVPATTTEEFSEALTKSFLAPIVKVAKDNNIPLCFFRIKRSPLQRRENDPKFQEYLRSLVAFFKAHEVCYIDENGDSAITDDLFTAPSDDHIGPKTAYTKLFVRTYLQQYLPPEQK